MEFSYSPLGYAKGKWISLVAILLWIGLLFWEKKGHKLFPEKPVPVPAVADEAESYFEEGGERDDHTEADVHHPQGD